MTSCIHSRNANFRCLCIEELIGYGFDIVPLKSTLSANIDLVIYEIPFGVVEIPTISCTLLVLISALPSTAFSIPSNAIFFRKPIDVRFMVEKIVEDYNEMVNKA